ncbi:MAG: YbjN domain-containing protein [Oscillospiraceae bacterium]|jgi:hypothetical protein|nr:YbjN domain-containing protein [Oscillospiraceae bacterium]
MSYSAVIAKQVDLYLHSQDWHYDFDQENGAFDFGMNISGKVKNLRMRIMLGDDYFTVYAIAPMRADENDLETLDLVNEYLTRANFGLRTGNFELDFRDGEMRYKASLFCADEVPSIKMIERVVDVPFLMWKRYGTGMINVLYGGKSPADEIAAVETE